MRTLETVLNQLKERHRKLTDIDLRTVNRSDKEHICMSLETLEIHIDLIELKLDLIRRGVID